MRKILEIVGLAALAALLWITLEAFLGPKPLPASIPTHFGADGHPNAWGSPSSLWLLPIVAVALYALITLASRFPGSFNFPVRATRTNRMRLEAIGQHMIAWIKAELACLFLAIQWSIVVSVQNGRSGLSPVILPVALVAVFGTIGLSLIAMIRAAR